MGNSFCKKCYIDDNDEDYGDLFMYNSSNNLYYTDVKENIKSTDNKYKYKTTPGPPIIVRDKKSYIKALTLL